ncbi:hypothetical protein M2454_002608 [Aequitasia blattaphilus]|uniref:Uncharacterized protein n=1 Tax=Aequitasia blattaphilus TaxID=2949332 RepID=A0ABT1ED54_9FIRM|nr:hypothetical protein [Aequitasia blattaphilus]MCP1103713.1 hypothetical protein [Aequitasia blattaphilus]MCR8616353.1 hypothetical protein [Aequitasia blattaphilus]
MAVVFSYGLILAISIFIGFVFTIIGLFLGHIILFDSIFLAAIRYGMCTQQSAS